jgi:aspartyl-tRNA(Asn)/glutamyl-tRNA(Gln) amidotransferase subunit C
MTDLGRDTVEHVARLARLALTEPEKGKFARQLSEVLLYMQRLAEVTTDGVEPTSHVVNLENIVRKDSPGESLASDDVMRNAPQGRDGMFIVPRVIEGEAP